MSVPKRRGSFNRILVDMNTQCDFLLPKGALPVANRLQILPNIRKLMNWARSTASPVISSLEAHRSGEATRGLPAHCIDRTIGQRKLPFTLMPRRAFIEGDNTLDLPCDPFRRHQQVIFTKRDRDFLSNPKADRLVHSVTADHLVLFGVVTEFCVKVATLGLIARQQCVVVVRDACGHWNATDAELAFRQMEAKGAVLVNTDELLAGIVDERITQATAARLMPSYEQAEQLAEESGSRRRNSYVIAPIRNRHVPSDNGKSNGNGNGHGHANNPSPSPRKEPDLVPPEIAASALRRTKMQARPRRDLA